MEEKTRIWLMVGISVVILLGSGMVLVLIEGVNLWLIAIFAILVSLVLVVLFMVTRALKELKSGYPLQDERSRSLSMRAGHLAFYVSMYLMLGLGILLIALEDEGMTIPSSEMMFIVVAIMGSLHLAFSAYFSRRSKGSSE